MKKKFTIHLDSLYDCLDAKNNTAKTQYGCVKYESISRADGYNYFSDTNDTSDPDCMDKETAEQILEALEQDEQDTQDKLQRQQGKKRRVEKEW